MNVTKFLKENPDIAHAIEQQVRDQLLAKPSSEKDDPALEEAEA